MSATSKWFEDLKLKKEAELPLPEGFQVRESIMDDAAHLAGVRLEREGIDYKELLSKVSFDIDESLKVDTTFMFTALAEGVPIGYSIMRYFVPFDGLPANTSPEGWYLLGLAVLEKYRRRGVGRELIKIRLMNIPGSYDTAYYFTNPKNLVSMAVHKEFGFTEIKEDIIFPGRKHKTVYYRTDLKKLRANNFNNRS